MRRDQRTFQPDNKEERRTCCRFVARTVHRVLTTLVCVASTINTIRINACSAFEGRTMKGLQGWSPADSTDDKLP